DSLERLMAAALVLDSMSALPKEEVKKAVERRNPERVPLVMTHWWGEGLWEQYGERLFELDRYPVDAPLIMKPAIDFGLMDLPWRRTLDDTGAHDAGGVIPDWKYLDEFIERLPDPDRTDAFADLEPEAAKVHGEDRYLLWGFWNLFFEMPWTLRGMENLMVDYYENPEEVHRMHDALCTQYEAWIRHAARVLKPDGFWSSDDLGHQTQPMMRPSQFREFLKPYYVRIARTVHECGMHFWLHSCGNNEPLMGDLIEAGVDVFHPVQKHTMDEVQVARDYGDRITFLVGFDVQHLLQEGSPDDVRREVRHLMDTFDRPEGGMCLASGNGIVAGTPFANIEAFFDESYRYGLESRRVLREVRG
ncbi:MAG TPA: uroporphyrinogen decarboxylase family protein, partial [Fimbriimonas sp.]